MSKKKIILALLALWLLAGCELAQFPQATPTPNIQSLDTATPTIAPTLTPSITLSPAPILESPSPTVTAGPPTDTPTVTPTPNPYATYVIQQGDTLLYIIQLPPFYYRSDSIIPEILKLNLNIPDINHLPGPGSSIIIPLPTATATPRDFDLTASAQANVAQVSVPGNTQIIQIIVKVSGLLITAVHTGAPGPTRTSRPSQRRNANDAGKPPKIWKGNARGHTISSKKRSARSWKFRTRAARFLRVACRWH